MAKTLRALSLGILVVGWGCSGRPESDPTDVIVTSKALAPSSSAGSTPLAVQSSADEWTLLGLAEFATETASSRVPPTEVGPSLDSLTDEELAQSLRSVHVEDGSV